MFLLPKVIEWRGEATGKLLLLDQTLLPTETIHLQCENTEAVWQAIRRLSVRGAPAIGIAAAYGVVLAVGQSVTSRASVAELTQCANDAIEYLATSRPTAVNLFWALDRMKRRVDELSGQMISNPSSQSIASEFATQLLAEAKLIHDEDRLMCESIGANGFQLLRDCNSVLTHCNAGSLATGGIGTALAPIYTAYAQGKSLRVFADETRPLLQGARLTAWELATAGVDVTVICDNMAASMMRRGQIDAVIVGADRITSRGDVANKIGTYGVALMAKYHRIPFYVAAPSSTFDLDLSDGDEIPIEQREAKEVTCFGERQTVPDGVQVANPAFDVTPAELVTAIVTERGIIAPVNEENLRRCLSLAYSPTHPGAS